MKVRRHTQVEDITHLAFVAISLLTDGPIDVSTVPVYMCSDDKYYLLPACSLICQGTCQDCQSSLGEELLLASMRTPSDVFHIRQCD